MFFKKLLDLTSPNIDVGQVAQHFFLRYWFFEFSSITEGHRNKKIIRHRPLCTYLVAAPNLAPDTLKCVAFGMAWPNLVVKTKSVEKIVYYPRKILRSD